MNDWNIVRTKPIGHTYGRGITAFFRNIDYFLTTVDVYADGAIDCWGFVDRTLFVNALISRRVTASPEPGSFITLTDLGYARAASTAWNLNVADLRDSVESIIHELNPEGRDLIDMRGDDTETRDGARSAKLGLSDAKPFRRDADGTDVLGARLPVFIRNGDELSLDHWFIYADGLTQFGCDGDLRPIEEAAESIRDGGITTMFTDGAWITIDGLGKFKVERCGETIEPLERIREAHDRLAVLRGGRAAIDICFEAHMAYEESPSDENRELLRSAYEAVPRHLRIYCGDMDSRDWPIRAILYGEEEY